jgi:hypothetical protein
MKQTQINKAYAALQALGAPVINKPDWFVSAQRTTTQPCGLMLTETSCTPKSRAFCQPTALTMDGMTQALQSFMPPDISAVSLTGFTSAMSHCSEIYYE